MITRVTIMILGLFLSLGANAQEIYKDDFSKDTQMWRLINDHGNQSQIKPGKLSWKHQGMSRNVITGYFNRLDKGKDWEVEVTFRLVGVGSEYGLAWGGMNPQNMNYLFFKNKKFAYYFAEKGQLRGSPEYKPNLKIRLDENTVTIKRTGGVIEYYCNGSKLASNAQAKVYGLSFGFALLGNSAIEVKSFAMRGTELPINLPKDLFYHDDPVNLGANVNSPYEELTPMIAPDGKGIYFSRRRAPMNVGGGTDQQDAYYSKLEGGKWTKAENMGRPINNHAANAVNGVTPDGNTLLLMNTYDNQGKQKGMGVSMSHKTSTGWTVPRDVPVRKFYNKSGFNDYFLANDSKTLLLAIEREGTYGARDIYVSFLQNDESWSEPRNLGPMINTAGTELTPFLASDGKTLYFSSTGHPGYGKNDIFISKRLDNTWKKWSKPQNLGKPLNGPGFDAYYSVPASGDYAFFVSNDKSLGANDIFKIKLPSNVRPNPVVLIKGFVRNSNTKKPIGTDITYRTFKNDKEVGRAISDPVTGYYEIVLPVEEAYSFFAQKKGYYSVSDRIDLIKTKDYQEIEVDLWLTPIALGETVHMKNVLFHRGEARLTSGSYAELDRLIKMMKENPGIEIELGGHTDNQGSAELNVKLSQERVDKAKDYLVSKGISDSRVIGKGYGGTKPIADNRYEHTRRLNRRVEFVIVKH